MKRVVFILAIVGLAALAGAFWYFRTCCAPPTARNAANPDTPVASASARGDTQRELRRDGPVAPSSSRGDASPATPAAAKRLRTIGPTAPAESATLATPTTATLRVMSDVPGAQVFLNREFVGAAPATANALKPGTYQLNVAAPGFDNHVETLELTPGEREIAVKFRQVRLNATLPVVHKHRLGSCKGQLIATPEGLRYETTDIDDAFTAPLSELETFQVDYLNKNLRIQPRKGKRYDFTDPDGNADSLFVFHRDVERARERLRAP